MMTRKPNTRLAVLVLAAVCLQSCGSKESDSGSQLISDYSGHGSFQPLYGVGAVVEATVAGHLGPRAELNDFGAVNYPGRPEDADLWTTPFGLPVLLLNEIDVIQHVDGSKRAERVSDQVAEASLRGSSIEVSAPVGVYTEGERYQFWLKPWEDTGFMTYLAFDSAGVLVEGLGMPDPVESFERLGKFTNTSRTESLADLAREFNESSESGLQGPIMDEIFGPAPSGPVRNESYYPSFADELSNSVTSQVEVEVFVVGADPRLMYGVRGSSLLGWSATNDDGEASVRGWVPFGEELALVSLVTLDDARAAAAGTPVVGTPTFVVDKPTQTGDEVLRVLYQLEPGGKATVESGLTLQELDMQRRSSFGLAPEG